MKIIKKFFWITLKKKRFTPSFLFFFNQEELMFWKNTNIEDKILKYEYFQVVCN